jgi:hypothetical protein
MRIGNAGTSLPNFGGANYLMGLRPEGGTDLHLALIEAAWKYRQEIGSEGSSVALLNALTEFMGKVNIFRPIIEVWAEVRKIRFMIPDGALPRGHVKAGKRGIHVPADGPERQSDGWSDIGTVVLSENLSWGVVWLPNISPRGLSGEELQRQRRFRFQYQPLSASKLVRLKFRAGGGCWGITNSLLREVLLAQERAESRAKFFGGMGQTLMMAEQIARVPDEK